MRKYGKKGEQNELYSSEYMDDDMKKKLSITDEDTSKVMNIGENVGDGHDHDNVITCTYDDVFHTKDHYYGSKGDLELLDASENHQDARHGSY